MRHLLSQKSLMRRHLVFILGVCMSLYLGYHTLQGERSLSRLWSLERHIDAQEQVLQGLRQDRAAIERKVVMLRPTSLDPDYLEERIRLVLGFTASDELVVIHDKS